MFRRKRKLDENPNRLFLSYIQTWRDEAKEKESKVFHVYNKAFKSLSKYPLPLQSGKEAMILENFGNKICSMLDAKLAKDSAAKCLTPREYLEESREVSNKWWKIAENLGKDKLSVVKNTERTTKRAPGGTRQKAYIPSKNSGGYAILVALYRNQLSGSDYMKKAELQREAQPYSTKSFVFADPGSRYTAWSSMATLLNKCLVRKYSNPAKFEITESGIELAAKLERATNHDTNNQESKNTQDTQHRSESVGKVSFKQTTCLREMSDSDDGSPPVRVLRQVIDISQSSTDEEADDVVVKYETNSSKQFKENKFDARLNAATFVAANKCESEESSGEEIIDRFESLKKVQCNPNACLLQMSDCDERLPVRKPSGNSEIIDITYSSADEDMDAAFSKFDFMKSRIYSDNSMPDQPAAPSLEEPKSSVLSCKDNTLTTKDGDKRHERVEFQLEPGRFDILLAVDFRELSGENRKQDLKREISKHKIPYVERVLQVGDFIWIAKSKQDSSGCAPKELVLDYIIERKCMSDLAQSIRDGRFHEQKIRLKQCGLKNIIYLVENLNQIQHQSLPEKTLRQALYNTKIIDSMFVKYSLNMTTTALYLSKMTKRITEMFISKTLQACDMKDLKVAPSHVLTSCKLLTFNDFNDESMKRRGLNVSQLFTRQLMQISGLSCDRAQAITSLYPTPQILLKAYQACSTRKEKEEMLVKIKTGLLRRNLGISLSRCVFHLFNS